MSTPPAHTVAVLGLGRLGASIAARLAAQGRDVIGWTRSGRPADAVRTTADPKDAVAQARLVLLALFDGPACRQVLDEAGDSLAADTIVVNVSTVAHAEATRLAQELGPCYVHAPVIGSVPAVTTGTLQILAAASDATALERARPVLEALGTVRPAPDAATAAALKLIANQGLAGTVLALRDTLRQADALGLPRAQVLDVLELGHLGGLVASRRHALEAPPSDAAAAGAGRATFTIGALAKDLALLAAASGTPLRGASGVGDTPADPEADIAAAATAPAPGDAVLRPLRSYIRGHATGDARHFRDAFLPTARIEGIRDGAFTSWTLDEYCALFPGRPAPDEPSRSRRIDAVDVHGTVATATMTLHHGPDTFTDIFLLVRVGEEWRIANKAYHRRGTSRRGDHHRPAQDPGADDHRPAGEAAPGPGTSASDTRGPDPESGDQET
ncbi:NAD(P)-binding domain-containing protein [Streptomyces sp. SBST2-5]|uniref:NAD(P)-binding domain-containing protein n=1 Tax=Streptomyces composti TaxID=2720025 RepID=A0ABX1A5S4_9ACTN|nr:nuclear transport factor 2 family protein [Streptomyces composti]NJP51799.1 NAD(P)-binding domain-containing protein [Streptomyces composti]